MAPDAGPLLARHQVDERRHVLQRHKVFVEQLEKDVLSGRRGEIDRSVFVDLRNAIDLLAMDVDIQADSKHAFLIPGPRQYAHHSHILDPPALDARQPLVYVLDKQRARLLLIRRVGARGCECSPRVFTGG